MDSNPQVLGKCDGCNASPALVMVSGDEAEVTSENKHYMCPRCAARFLTYEAAEDHLAGYLDLVLLPWWEHWAERGLTVRDLGEVLREVSARFAESFVEPEREAA
jgi:hypothetical protein